MLRYDNFFEVIFFIELRDIILMDGSGGDFNSEVDCFSKGSEIFCSWMGFIAYEA